MLVEIIKTHFRATDPRTVIELKKGEVKEDEHAMKSARSLGKQVVQLIKTIQN